MEACPRIEVQQAKARVNEFVAYLNRGAKAYHRENVLDYLRSGGVEIYNVREAGTGIYEVVCVYRVLQFNLKVDERAGKVYRPYTYDAYFSEANTWRYNQRW